jgi:hypothetical protein
MAAVCFKLRGRMFDTVKDLWSKYCRIMACFTCDMIMSKWVKLLIGWDTLMRWNISE